MPYIKEEARERMRSDTPKNAGELNFVLTIMAQNYWYENDKNYQAFNDILGAFEGAKLELYRRMIAPYEDKKIEENGDVYRGEGPTGVR